MSRKLAKTVVVSGVLYPAGAAVPVDVAKAITAKGVWAEGAADPEDDEEDAEPSYSDLKVADLKAEIDRRNADRDPEDEGHLSNEGKKVELVAVLEADDLAAASDEGDGGDEDENDDESEGDES